MIITNYNELFELFDSIISNRNGSTVFSFSDFSFHFGEVLASFDSCKESPSKVGYTQLLSALSFGHSSLVSAPNSEKTKLRRYELSFYQSFAAIHYYVGELGYYVYNLYTNSGILVKRDLFSSEVNLIIHYRSKIFILHNWICDTPNSLLLTVLSPCPMFTQNEFEV